MRTSSLISRIAAIAVVSVFLGGPALASGSLSPPLSASREAARSTSQQAPAAGQPTGSPESAQLAAREKAAPELQDYRGGGGGIYIGGSAVGILLLVILLIILL